MSSIRALSLELPQRSDASLRELFLARPDVISPSVPDFAALAARACARISVHRALDTLDTPHLRAIEVSLVHDGAPGSPGPLGTVPLDAGTLKTATGDTKATAARILRRLNTLALLYKVPGGYLPVSSLHEVIGAHPAGLGRSYQELAGPAGERLHTLVTQLGLPGQNPAQALAERFNRPGWWPDLMKSAPENTAALLARFDDGPVGALPKNRRPASSGPARDPVDFLLSRGILIPLDHEHVELPREAGLALRGGRIFQAAARPPMVPASAPISAARRDNAALGAIAELLRETGLLLTAITAEPLPTLRSGGVGVRALRPLGMSLGATAERLAFLLELLAAAELIHLDADTSTWALAPRWATAPAPAALPVALPAALSAWDRTPRSAQWLLLAKAWFTSGRAPALIGQPVPGGNGSINPLAAEVRRADAPALRRLLLETMAQADGDLANQETLFELARWQRPRLWRRLSRLAGGMVREMEDLGITGSGALTDYGSLLADDGPAAARILDQALPAPVATILLQADLTAVAPGFLDPELSHELTLIADREGHGPAAMYRFSAASLRRALDAGQGAEQIIEFLQQHSSTSIPQPLEYLIRDTAARHGLLRISGTTSVITGADEALLSSLLHDSTLAALGLRRLAPGVLSSQASPSELAQALRAAGHSPALERSTAPQRVRRGTITGAETPISTSTEADLEAQLSMLRSRPAGIPASSAVVPQLSIETLREAIRLHRPVRLTMVDAAGNPERLRLVPLSVANGRLRVFDPERDTERIMSIHRIVDVDIVSADSDPQQSSTNRADSHD